jgi:hypothetical protein
MNKTIEIRIVYLFPIYWEIGIANKFYDTLSMRFKVLYGQGLEGMIAAYRETNSENWVGWEMRAIGEGDVEVLDESN